MSLTVEIEEAQAHLSDLIAKLGPGEEIVITQNEHAVAKLIGENTVQGTRRIPGSAVGSFSLTPKMMSISTISMTICHEIAFR